MNQKNRKNMKNASAGSNLQNISPKTMVAVVLMTLMGLLWVRVLLNGKGGPAAANAAAVQQQQAAAGTAAMMTQVKSGNVRIERLELPVLSGRNDTITHNPFSADNWKAFAFHQEEEPKAVVAKQAVPENTAEQRHQTNIKRISDRMTLEGVICDSKGVPFQAFVDGKILSVGSALTVKEGPDKYELKLKTIKEKEVLFVWNDLTVVLKLAETAEH